MRYFVTAIGTDSGKTVVSAILVKALQADYWKPIQAGFPTDTEIVKALTGSSSSRFHPEIYLLPTPESPHAAAQRQGKEIMIKEIRVPETQGDLIIEGAGGLMVPLNDHELVVDMINILEAEVILVANLYLGSINHTLLSVDCLNNRGLKIKGIVFNGPENRESEEVILRYSGYPLILKIRQEDRIDSEVIEKYAHQLLKDWK